MGNRFLPRIIQRVQYCFDPIVRLTGDNAVIDPQIIDALVQTYFAGNVDSVTNAEPRTFPEGVEAEVVSFAAIERAWREARLPSEREHVTPFDGPPEN